MDIVSRAFNFLSDPKRVPHVDGDGNHPNHNAVQAFLAAPENVVGGVICAAATLAFMSVAQSFPSGPLKAIVMNGFMVPLVGLAFNVAGGAIAGLVQSPQPPVTVYKQGAIGSSAQMLLKAGQENQMMRLLTVLTGLPLGIMAVGVLWNTSKGPPVLMSMNALVALTAAPAFARNGIEAARIYLRNRMILKGHWSAIVGRKPPRIGPDKPEHLSSAVKGTAMSPG